MGKIIEYEEIDLSSPRTVSVSGTAAELSSSRLGLQRRTFFSIIPLTAGVTVTISFGDQTAVALQGISLIQNQPFSMSDSEEFKCWQGAIQVVASGAGNVAVTEIFER